jgi:ubiquinol-cytochrome c reductase cytochrome b subunit
MASTDMNPLYKWLPLAKDVREKGFVPAVAAKTNEIVSRITVGMDIADVRSVLRGDPPPRPNPRLKPHADAFLYHIRPSYYHQAVTGLYPSFRMGWLSFFMFMMETLTGLFLMIFYTPSPTAAYSDMLNLLARVPLGQLMRDLHRIGAEFMVAVVALHMLRTFLTGSYKKPRQFTWATGVLLLGTTLFLSFSGYLLPWDQLSLWAVTIGTSMAEKSPTPPPIGAITGNPEFMGYYVNLIMRGGPDIREAGLLRWYLLHVFALPLITFLFISVHYYKVVLYGHSLPPESEPVGDDTARKVPMDKRAYFTPDVLGDDLLLTGLMTAVMIVIAIFVYHAPLEHHADPQITPLHTTAPWYFLWLQGLLKLGDPGLMGVVLPTIIGVILLAVPYFDIGASRRYGDRKVGITAGLLFSAVLIVLTFMGTPRFKVQTSADQEILQNALPMEGVGPVRAVPFDDLQNGVYEIRQDGIYVNNAKLDENQPNAPLYQALWGIHEDTFKTYIATNWPSGGLDPATSFTVMQIEDWQPGLKHVVLTVHFTDKTGTPRQSPKSEYVHKDSNYTGGGH